METLEILESLLHGFKFLLWAIATHLFHYRQNFFHWSLWVPVIALYFLAAILLLAEFYPAAWVLTLLFITLVIVIATHLWGFYLHFDGVGKRVGGQNVHNHMVGPPIILPLIVATVAAIDLLRLLQGRF
ncbi:hypothetical protein [Halonatronum saccharophilum]|uniref:hypothetical protein n=1 Tax=Halonatronum saccharophilum TaxID=150060 RepID=UPI0004B58C2E|nr:hypothetical protein [Halonatronum saccharophilum]